jgi:ABC-type transport system involved in multi-copper enzyme maturation permease subunit
MWSLIEREIHDNIVNVASLLIASAIIVSIFICDYFWDLHGAQISVPSVLLGLMLLGFAVLGGSQMNGDRTHRISSLLSTLAVTRNRIFLARIFVGLVVVLVSLVPGIVGALALLRADSAPVEFFRRPLAEISIMIVLTGWTCYGVGLLIGWSPNKAHRLVGFLFLVVLVWSLVVAKGFGPEAMALLVLSLGASLLRTWYTFTSASL